MTPHRTIASISAFLFAILITSPAFAQTPAAGASASSGHSLTLGGSFGYLFAKINGDQGDTIPNGWLATLDVVFDGRYAGVVEFAGNYPSDEHLYRSVLAGGRFIFLNPSRPVRPFVQVLLGKGRSSAIGDEVNAFTVQPGVGVDIRAASHFGIRLQGDYDWRSRTSGDVTGYRFAASIVIR